MIIIMDSSFGEYKWEEIDRLQADLVKRALSAPSNIPTEDLDRERVIMLIEQQLQECVQLLGKGIAPSLCHANTSSWGNTSFHTDRGVQLVDDSTKTSVRFDSVLSVNKFALTIRLLSLIHELLQRNTYCTKRDLYYQAPELFGSQTTVDRLVDNISCMLAIPRWHLHVLATSKGCIAGNLQFLETDGNYVDCRHTTTGVVVPSHIDGLSNLQSKAKFVLIVEKDATFQTLLEGEVCKKLEPCIVITGKGFPDMNTRLMVRKLWDTFHLPSLVLVDADPHGMEIMMVYRYGSRSLSFEAANLTVPAVRWLGLLPSDIQRMNIPESALLCLTQADRDKAQDLLQRSYVSQHLVWKNEIDTMLSSGMKAELQSLSAISASFLTDVYLPNKIRFGGWI